MKKIIAVILCALMLCLVLASCASGGGVVGGSETVGGEGTPETEEKGFLDKVQDFFWDLVGDNDESKESEQTSDTEPVTDTEPDDDEKNWTATY